MRSCITLLLAGSLIISVACERVVPPLEPPGAVMSVSTDPPLVFAVSNQNGDRVEGATVRVFTGGGPVATAISDAYGLATVNLPEGSYCATARLVPEEWLGLDIIVPSTPFAYTPVAAFHGPVVRTAAGWVPFTPDAFEECYTDLPLFHDGPASDEGVTLGAGFNVQATVMGLDGQPLDGVDVYAVIPVDVPWRPSDLDPDIRTGFFSFINATGSPANVVVSPNAPFALEYQAPFADGFNLTASGKGTAGAGGSGSFMLDAAPLMCIENVETFPAGEKSIDYLQVQYGYHASLSLTPDLGIAAVQVKHSGDGKSRLDFRVDLPSGRRTVTLDYACENGNCTAKSVKFSGGPNNGMSLEAYFRHLGGGVVKVSAVLMGIPANHQRVTFNATASGDQVPLSSKEQETSAYILYGKPGRCSVQSSNDDRWAIGVL